MRIFAVSDLHTDFAENRRRLQQVSSTSYLQDVLVVAGDIADDLRIDNLRPLFEGRAILSQCDSL